MSTPLFFCLRIPEFAAQALIRLRPALATAAVAVLEGDPPLEKTCAATLQARRLGVRHGMTRTELESFPHLTVLRRSQAEEQSSALTLLEMAARFTPRAEELPRTSAHTLALDMAGSTRIFGPPHVIGQKLFRAARELGFFSRVVSSSNLHTAVCLARAPGNALITVPPGEERTYLHDLPLTALDLTGELLDTFTAWGLRTAGDLAALMPADLVARLGQEGHRLHRLATGQQDHLLVPAEPTFALEEHLAFDAPVDNLESLLFVLAPMLDQLIARARNRALLLASVTVQLHLERSADQTDRDRHADQAHSPTTPALLSRPGSTRPSRPVILSATPSAQPKDPCISSARVEGKSLALTQSASPSTFPTPIVLTATAPSHYPLSTQGTAANTATTTRSAPSHLVISTGSAAVVERSAVPATTAQTRTIPHKVNPDPQHSDSETPVHTRTLKPALPLDDRNLLLKLLQLDLQANPAPAAILAITLHAEPGPRPGVQSGLFSPQSPEPMRLEVTLARIAALVGEERVGQAVLTDNHQSESFRIERFTVTEPPQAKLRRSRTLSPKPAEASPVRTGVALRRLRPAPHVEVTYADGKPFLLRCSTSTLPNALTVHRAFGPWRRSGHWWSSEVWSHEEWDIDAQATDGTRLLALLTNDRLRLQWQLEALYD